MDGVYVRETRQTDLDTENQNHMRGTTGQDSRHLRGGTHEKISSRVHLLPAAQPELACDIPCLCVCTTDARDADVRRDDTERTPTTID